jgi:hypothetical protein
MIKKLNKLNHATTDVYKNAQHLIFNKFKSTKTTSLTKTAQKILNQEYKPEDLKKNRNIFNIMSEATKQVAFINAKMSRGQVNICFNTFNFLNRIKIYIHIYHLY